MKVTNLTSSLNLLRTTLLCFQQAISEEKTDNPEFALFLQAKAQNQWFTTKSVQSSVQAWIDNLEENKIEQFVSNYNFNETTASKKVAVIAAGNIPLVGFHDVLCVFLSGHNLVLKPASDDVVLLPYFTKILFSENEERLEIIKDTRLADYDAVVATGSANTNRYFEYYFKAKPSVLRSNRTSVAVLTGDENNEELTALGMDIFQYFGLGCRNVSQLLVPKGYDFIKFFEAIEQYGATLLEHNKYLNNYDYHKALLLLNVDKFLDNNFMLLKEGDSVFTPLSMVHFKEYSSQNDIEEHLKANEANIQCIVGKGFLPLGEAQCPSLSDFADNVDTMQFLKEL
jgi:hypothetical protein